MATVKGCNLPDDLLYDVENHIWFKELGDGTVPVSYTHLTLPTSDLV